MSDPRIKVHALRCGGVGTDESVPDRDRSYNPFAYTGVLRGKRHRIWLPVYCYLIEHPQGKLLIDTAWHTDVRTDQRRALSWELSIASKAKLPPGKAVSEQLAGLGFAPHDIDMVFLTHLDVDHVSGLRLMTGAHRICTSRQEFGFPGGEPAVVNIAMYASDVPDRFPLNQLSAMVTNVLGIIVLYGLPFFFPQALWLCLAPMLVNFGQLLSHGVMTNIKLRGIYNPGLAAVVFLHLPISVYFIWYVSANRMMTRWDWLFGFLYAAVCAGFLVGFSTYALFATRKTKWPFAPNEMARFDVEGKMERRVVRVDCDTPLPLPQRRLQEVQKKIHPDG